jgi:polysaccharide export outer membrane protein
MKSSARQPGAPALRPASFDYIRDYGSCALLGLLMSFVVLILTCCTPGGDLPPLQDASAPGAYLLGPGDKLRVITFGSEQLTGEFQINDAGKLALPLLGTIPAAGESTEQLAGNIARDLKDKNLFRDPNVSVEVSTYRPIFILGEVNKPGSYPYEPGMTVLSAVSTAGGFTYRAQTDFASIVRSKDGTATEGKVTRQTFVMPGDVINVFERRF